MSLDAVARIVDPTRIKERRRIGARAALPGPPQLLQGREMDQGRRQGRAQTFVSFLLDSNSFALPTEHGLSLTNSQLWVPIHLCRHRSAP
jgi:hypothetical protein